MSRIAMGLWRLADWDYSPQQRLTLIEQLLELGVTTFDLADIYGDYRCEQLFGEALQLNPELRGRMEIVTKCGIRLSGAAGGCGINHYDSRPQHVRASVESSLKKMRVEQLDLLLLHRPDPLMDADLLAAELDALVQSSTVKHVGVSNFLPHQADLLQSRLQQPLVVNQIEASVLSSEPMFDGQLDYCQQHKVIPMAWSPFAGGRLFESNGGEDALRMRDCLQALAEKLDSEPSRIALAWLLQHPSRMVPLLGSGNISRLRSSLAALELELQREDWFAVLRAGRGRDVD